jgi:hypothetical protein
MPRTLALLTALALSTAAVASARADPWTTFNADVDTHGTFRFPAHFEADSAIGVYDANRNCIIDTAANGDAGFSYPGVLIGATLHHGAAVGSPFALRVDVDANGAALVNFEPGLCGNILLYAEEQDAADPRWHYFVWFALPDGMAVPPIAGKVFDDANLGFDYGVGSYHGTSLTDLDEFHQVTFVKDVHAIGPDGQSPHHPVVHANDIADMHGTVPNPGHFFSETGDPFGAFPAAWPSMTAGVSGGPDVATLSNVVIDVPMIDEASWDGASRFTATKGVGRTIIGSGTSTPSTMPKSDVLTTTALVGDFTGDGRADVIVTQPTYTFTPLHAGASGGQFSITTPTEAYNWLNLPGTTSIVGDFDGDHRSDVLMFRAGWQSTPIYFGGGTGSFRYTNVVEASGWNLMNDTTTQKLVGDFDGDGRTDLALWKAGWSSTPVYRSNGAGGFVFTNYVTPSWVNDPAARRLIGDFNGDGRSDILLARSGWSTNPVLFSNGNGSFRTTNLGLPWNVLNDPDTVGLVADVDGDGRADVAMWHPGWNSTPIYLSNGDGTFRFVNYLTSTLVNSRATEKRLGDFDGDGRPDIFMFTPGSSSAAILYGLGNGAWDVRSVSVPYLALAGTEILVGDFDGDRRTDVLGRRRGWVGTATYLGSPTRGQMTLGVWNVGLGWIDQ